MSSFDNSVLSAPCILARAFVPSSLCYFLTNSVACASTLLWIPTYIQYKLFSLRGLRFNVYLLVITSDPPQTPPSHPLKISWSGSPYWWHVCYLEGAYSHHTSGAKRAGRGALGMGG